MTTKERIRKATYRLSHGIITQSEYNETVRRILNEAYVRKLREGFRLINQSYDR